MPWSEGLIYLSENQYGFSRTRLGFPSISGCRAIVYQTSRGLFGFHQASGAFSDNFARFGKKFAGFVSGHSQGAGHDRTPHSGLNMYVAAKVGMGGSYSFGKEVSEHLAEIKAFASALRFPGQVSSYNLSTNWSGPGVYVEVKVTAGVCEMFANPWVEHHDESHTGPVDGLRLADHKLSYPPKDEFIVPNKVFIKVDITGRQRIDPIVLDMR